MIVIADTGPINYLILSGYIGLLERLYGSLVLPAAVERELLHHKAPTLVRQWASAPPAWVEVRVSRNAARFGDLGPGEREALALALEMKADFVLIDETLGRKAAVANGMAVKGILAVLEEAAGMGFVNLQQAVQKLRTTSIFLADEVVQTVLKRHSEKPKNEY